MKRIKKFIKNYWINLSLLMASVIMMVCAYQIYCYLEVHHYRDVNGIVYKKYAQDISRYKSTRIETQFIMVVKDKETNKYFDIQVTPTTFALHNEGDDINFKKISKVTLGDDLEYNNSFLTLLSIILVLFSIITFVVAFFLRD